MSKPAELEKLKKKIAQESYVKEFSNISAPIIESKDDISNDSLKLMFARWVTHHQDFDAFSRGYERIIKDSGWDVVPQHTKVILINPTNLTAVNEILGDRTYNVTIDGQTLMVILSKSVKYVMWNGWEDHGELVRLLLAYCKFTIH